MLASLRGVYAPGVTGDVGEYIVCDGLGDILSMIDILEISAARLCLAELSDGLMLSTTDTGRIEVGDWVMPTGDSSVGCSGDGTLGKGVGWSCLAAAA